MDFKKKYKAEDLLSGRIPDEELHLISANERELSEEMKSVFKNLQSERLTEIEKEELWGKIRSAVNTDRKRNMSRRWIFQIAASLLIVFALGYWN